MGGGEDQNGVNDVFVNDQAGTSADLSIAKADAPDPVLVGQALTYTLTVTNNGPSPATGVTLSDTLPDGVTFGSATPSQGSCSPSGGTVSCNLGSLASGASATVKIVVTPTAAGQLSNTASTRGSEADPNLANNSTTASATVNAPACPPEISFGQTIQCSIDAPGEVGRFTFAGDVAGHRVRVRVVETGKSPRLAARTEVLRRDGTSLCATN